MALNFTDIHELSSVIHEQDFSLDELDKIWWYLEHTRFGHQVEQDTYLGEELKHVFSQIDVLSLSSDDIKSAQYSIEEAYRSHPDFVPEDDSEELLAF